MRVATTSSRGTLEQPPLSRCGVPDDGPQSSAPSADASGPSDSSTPPAVRALDGFAAVSHRIDGHGSTYVQFAVADGRRLVDAVAPAEHVLDGQQHQVRAGECKSARGWRRGHALRRNGAGCCDSRISCALLASASPTRPPAARCRACRSWPPTAADTYRDPPAPIGAPGIRAARAGRSTSRTKVRHRAEIFDTDVRAGLDHDAHHALAKGAAARSSVAGEKYGGLPSSGRT